MVRGKGGEWNGQDFIDLLAMGTSDFVSGFQESLSALSFPERAAKK